MCRYSVNVFRPPFQSGRTSPEASLSRADLHLSTGSTAEGSATQEEEELHAVEEGEVEEQASVSSEMAAAQASAHSAEDLNSLSTQTTDSAFSELLSCSQDPFGEKETSCEKAVKPEGIFIMGFSVLFFFNAIDFLLFLSLSLFFYVVMLCVCLFFSCSHWVPTTLRV